MLGWGGGGDLKVRSKVEKERKIRGYLRMVLGIGSGEGTGAKRMPVMFSVALRYWAFKEESYANHY
jgi:hypothetical protein